MKIGEIWQSKIHPEDLVKILYIECIDFDDFIGYEHVDPKSDCDPIEHMVVRGYFIERYVKSRYDNVL
jgi:hypothetical protein